MERMPVQPAIDNKGCALKTSRSKELQSSFIFDREYKRDGYEPAEFPARWNCTEIICSFLGWNKDAVTNIKHHPHSVGWRYRMIVQG